MNELVEYVAATNPLSAADAYESADAQRERIRAIIRSRQGEAPVSSARSFARRRVIVVAAALALAVPAIAAASFGFDFGFSNEGSEVSSSALAYETVRVLDRMRANPDEVRLLGERDGISFFGAHSRTGDPCFAVGVSQRPRLQTMACLGGEEDGFPSADQPVLDFSPARTRLGAVEAHLVRIAGFAADPIRRIGIVDSAGNTHWVAVEDNLYADSTPATSPAAEIVAADSEGRIVWSRKVTAPPALSEESG